MALRRVDSFLSSVLAFHTGVVFVVVFRISKKSLGVALSARFLLLEENELNGKMREEIAERELSMVMV